MHLGRRGQLDTSAVCGALIRQSVARATFDLQLIDEMKPFTFFKKLTKLTHHPVN